MVALQAHQRAFMMTSTVVYVVIGIFSVVAVILFLRQGNQGSVTRIKSRAQNSDSPRQGASKPINRYRATSIISGQNSCAAVKAIKKKRFLVEDRDIPQLPLAACDAEKCVCKYKHHDDRRDASHDRRALSGLRTQLHEQSEGAERREKRGRRKSDQEW